MSLLSPAQFRATQREIQQAHGLETREDMDWQGQLALWSNGLKCPRKRAATHRTAYEPVEAVKTEGLPWVPVARSTWGKGCLIPHYILKC